MRDKSSRREFVRNSAKIVAGAIILPNIIPASALGKGGSTPPSDRIVIGAIGTGSQGMSNMRDFLELKKAPQFVAVCDVDASSPRKSKTDCR